jgi:hypothetical protein
LPSISIVVGDEFGRSKAKNINLLIAKPKTQKQTAVLIKALSETSRTT